MKKMFFRKSSSSSTRERQEKPGIVTGTKKENRNAEQLLSVCDGNVTAVKKPGFRRSRSLSVSSAVKDRGRFGADGLIGLRNSRNRFPSSHRKCDCSDCKSQFSRHRDSTERRNDAYSSPSNPNSPRNSIDSSSTSDQVLNLNRDGDHLHSRFFVDESNLFIPSHNNTYRKTSMPEHQNESPRKLAKDIVNRLQQLEHIRVLKRPIVAPIPTSVSDKHLDRQSCTVKGAKDEEYVTVFPEVSNFYHKQEDCMKNEAKLSELENEYLHEKLAIAEEIQSCLRKNVEEKENEITQLSKAVTTLRLTCSENERTIDGLIQCQNSENNWSKLQLQQLRLAEIEQNLRGKLEASTVEIQSLRDENVYLLERLKGARSGVKLDQELISCVQCLKNKGLLLVNESVHTCEELVRIIGRLDSREVHRYDMKVRGFKQDLQELSRSLEKVSFVLMEKSEQPESSSRDDLKTTTNEDVVQGDLRSGLKAECLLTSILKEELYSKEKEAERVQTELARTLCSHDVLKSEIQNAFDTISCLNHKLKTFELQMIEKDGFINQLRGEARSKEEELGATKSTLIKVSQERDLMWEEVKQYSEKNMLLNRELNSLQKKIDALEEDTLLKDGQISILKDSLSHGRPFSGFFGAEQGDLFKL